MKHFMKLCSSPFEMISHGDKTIELRLYDEKRQKINVGDTIVFTNIENPEFQLTAEVLNIHRFNSFDELYTKLPLDKCGYKKGEKADPADMEVYYPKEMQQRYGVVGIEIAVLSK